MIRIKISITSPRDSEDRYPVAGIEDGRMKLYSLNRWGKADEAGIVHDPGLTEEEFDAFVIEAKKAWSIARAAEDRGVQTDEL